MLLKMLTTGQTLTAFVQTAAAKNVHMKMRQAKPVLYAEQSPTPAISALNGNMMQISIGKNVNAVLQAKKAHIASKAAYAPFVTMNVLTKATPTAFVTTANMLVLTIGIQPRVKITSQDPMTM